LIAKESFLRKRLRCAIIVKKSPDNAPLWTFYVQWVFQSDTKFFENQTSTAYNSRPNYWATTIVPSGVVMELWLPVIGSYAYLKYHHLRGSPSSPSCR
jgi:hypothetical protein